MAALFPHLALVHLAATCALAGLIWTVQLAIYPLFDGVGREAFPAFHRRYVRGISWIVAPLMGVEALTAGLVLAAGERAPLFLLGVALIAAIWLVTFLVEVPRHRRLAAGFDAAAHRELVGANWARTLAWTARAALVSAWLFAFSGA